MTTEHESHCQNCFNIRQCQKEKLLRKADRPEEMSKCPIVRCRFNCLHTFHSCKLEEHELLCTKKIVPCINEEYGCPIKMERGRRAIHLMTCPASVVVCTVEWNRKPLPPWQTQPFLFNQEHLDVAAVLKDEKTVAEFKKILPTSLRSLLQTHNRKQPIMPLGVSGHRISNTILIQAKREKEAWSSFSDPDAEENDDESFSFNETPGGSKKSPPGLQESVCNKLKEMSLAPAAIPNFQIPIPERNLVTKGKISTTESEDDGTDVSEEISSQTGSLPISSASPILKKSEEIQSNPDTNPDPGINLTSSISVPGICNNCCKPKIKKPDSLSLVVDVTSKGACKYMNLYTFMCAREFRRDEYPNHFKSVHNEIITQLNGWLFARCPLANYGCPFGLERMFPTMSPLDNDHHVVYNSAVGSFCFTQKSKSVSGPQEYDTSLCDLPFELLVLLSKYLDPLSLNSLSLTNTVLRSICQLIVMERGIVVFDWERSLETGKWEVAGKKWIFSTSFTPMRSWTFEDIGVMANHMKTCSHFEELRHRPERPFSYPVSKDQL